MAVVTSVQNSEDANANTIASPAFVATAGNVITVFVRNSSSLDIASLTDTAGNIYIPNGQADISGVGGDAMTHYYAYNCLGHATNIINVTWVNNQTFRTITAFQADNIDYSSGDPLDQLVATRQSSANSITSSAFTRLQNNEIIFMGCGTASLSANYTEGVGYLPSPPLTVTSKDAASQYKIASSVVVGETATMSADVTTNWGSVVATFRTNAVAAGNSFWLFQ